MCLSARRLSEGGTSSAQYLVDHIFVYRCDQNLPYKSTMSKSRDTASRANTSIAAEESGISVACSLPRCRIVMANLAEGTARAAGCDTSFCCRTCAMPTEPRADELVYPTADIGRVP
jgi:hypothetical protein